MSEPEVIGALKPLFDFFGAQLTAEQWHQYSLALEHVNPGDLDDAMGDLRKSHGFRNAPLPAEILDRCDVHRKRRQGNELPVTETVRADPKEGEWQTFTVKGVGSFTVQVLPDDHPALKRYACLHCLDTGWVHLPERNPGQQPTYQRCGCVARNPVVQQERTKRAAAALKRVAG